MKRAPPRRARAAVSVAERDHLAHADRPREPGRGERAVARVDGGGEAAAVDVEDRVHRAASCSFFEKLPFASFPFLQLRVAVRCDAIASPGVSDGWRARIADSTPGLSESTQHARAAPAGGGLEEAGGGARRARDVEPALGLGAVAHAGGVELAAVHQVGKHRPKVDGGIKVGPSAVDGSEARASSAAAAPSRSGKSSATASRKAWPPRPPSAAACPGRARRESPTGRRRD